MRQILSTAWGKSLAVAGVVLSVIAAPAAAFAQTATPYGASNAQSDVTSFASSTFTSVAPMILAVAGAVIGVILLSWGVRTVLRKIKHFRVG